MYYGTMGTYFIMREAIFICIRMPEKVEERARWRGIISGEVKENRKDFPSLALEKRT